MCYFIALKRRSKNISHSGCLESSTCLVCKLDTDSFEYSHVTLGCQCATIGIDEAELLSILEKDEVPLVSCHFSPDGLMTPHLITAGWGTSKQRKYYAVSHVSLLYPTH